MRRTLAELPGIKQVLGSILTLRPAAALVEFDAKEVTDLAKYAVLHFAGELAIRVRDLESGTQGDGSIYLKTSSRKRDVFQVGDTAPGSAIVILPLDVHQVRAEHPGFDSAI